jgi:hypothetical protein
MNALRRGLAVLALVALAWAAAAWLTGGFVLAAGGLRISARDWIRPLLTAAVIAAAWVAFTGPRQAARTAVRLALTVHPGHLAALLALGTTVVAVWHNEWNVGGADGYAYASQADLWLARDLRVAMPIASEAPWPDALATFTPYGYRAAATGTALVPVTAPGLPIVMAALKWLFGHCAMFLVSPLAGGLLVWSTFVAGCRLGSRPVGLGGAWLVATSPAVLAMTKAVMSDVPAAAAWSVSATLLLGPTTGAAAAAGLAAGVALAIRPNLLLAGAALGVWVVWRDLRDRRGPARAVAFALAALPGPVLVAAVNTWLYGSPHATGYGDLGPLFAISHVPVNLARFGRWIAETQTPLALPGVAVMVLPVRRLWSGRDAGRGSLLFGGLAVAVLASYLTYVPFDAWWFLRFLLPMWPAMCLGTAALVWRAGEWGGRRSRAVSALALLALGTWTAHVAVARGVFPPGEGERRYATIASLVREATPAGAVVIAGQHAGALRYYGGRLTLRFDVLDPGWLEGGVAWLDAHGRPAYLLLEDWELPAFTRRFAAQGPLGRLELAPVLAYRAHAIAGTVYLFDPRRPAGPTVQPAPLVDPRPRCVPPGPPVVATAEP